MLKMVCLIGVGVGLTVASGVASAASVTITSDETGLSRVTLDGDAVTIADSAEDRDDTNEVQAPAVEFTIDQDYAFTYAANGITGDFGFAGVDLARVDGETFSLSFSAPNDFGSPFPDEGLFVTVESGDDVVGNSIEFLTGGDGTAVPDAATEIDTFALLTESDPEFDAIGDGGLRATGVLSAGTYTIAIDVQGIGQDRPGFASATYVFAAEPVAGSGSPTVVPTPSSLVLGGIGLLGLTRRRRHVA